MTEQQSPDSATASADNLIAELIKTQPHLLQNANHSGTEAAAFLAELRKGLIAMYRQPPG